MNFTDEVLVFGRYFNKFILSGKETPCDKIKPPTSLIFELVF
jgi:hypothetical protein